jgi:[acyl-carrier-protein] S-malonyltransferase
MSLVDNNLAFVFPGQGSQAVGMLAELATAHPEVEATFRTASEVLGLDLWALTQEGPAERLNQTRNTQPAMLAAGVAAWRVWCKLSEVRPGWMAGHSLGEYTALVCADALDFETALRLVAERARLMQEAVPAGTGAMAAILGLSDAEVVGICGRASSETETVTAANFNAPSQVVVAGDQAAVQRAIDLAKADGAKRAVLLPVSVPSHCPLMKPAADQFGVTLAATVFNSPAIGVVHNVDVATHPAPEVIRAALQRQLCGSVRWTESIQFIAQQGADRFVECGPGKVLLGLNKRIVPDARTAAIFDTPSLATALELAP